MSILINATPDRHEDDMKISRWGKGRGGWVLSCMEM